MNDTMVETVSGKVLDLMNPEPSCVDIEDIAWSLSRLARYNGHTIQKIPYTVGQHSICVAKRIMELCPDDYSLAMCGLLHDASECYTGDLTGPLKKIPELRSIIKGIEKKIDYAIAEAFGLPVPLSDDHDGPCLDTSLIKEADVYCQAIEAYNFMNSRGLNWDLGIQPSFIEYQSFEMPKPNIEVYEEFLELYKSLQLKIKNL